MELSRISRRQNLSEDVADRIVSQILSGALKPGDRLPTEQELGEKLGVGRTALREGLRPLALLNLIEVRPGDGTFVSRNLSQFFAKPLTWGLLIGEQNVTDMTETRELIEVNAVVLAAKRRTDEDMAKLDALLDKMEERLEDLEEFADLDVAFHVQVAAASGNALLSRLVLSMGGLLRPWLDRTSVIPNATRDALEAHREIREAIRKQDSARAHAVMEWHMREWGRNLRRIVALHPPADRR